MKFIQTYKQLLNEALMINKLKAEEYKKICKYVIKLQIMISYNSEEDLELNEYKNEIVTGLNKLFQKYFIKQIYQIDVVDEFNEDCSYLNDRYYFPNGILQFDCEGKLDDITRFYDQNKEDLKVNLSSPTAKLTLWLGEIGGKNLNTIEDLFEAYRDGCDLDAYPSFKLDNKKYTYKELKIKEGLKEY